jgi:hypothetical protein
VLLLQYQLFVWSVAAICVFATLTKRAKSEHYACPMRQRKLATIHSYDELIGALGSRVAQLRTTLAATSELAGLAERYVAKVVTPKPVRSLGRVSLGPILGALGCCLILCEDREQYERIKHRIVRRKMAPPRRKASSTALQASSQASR